MQKKFLTNLGLILFLNLLVKPFWILQIDRSVQNTVGSGEYGFYFVVLNLSFLFNIILDFGITNYNQRNIAQHQHLLNKYMSSILVLKLMFSATYIIITFTAALILGYSGRQLNLLGWLAFNQVLISYILYLRSNITGLLMFKTDSLLSVTDRLLMIIICSVLLWGNLFDSPFQIEWFVWAQTAAYSFTALIATFIVVRKARFKKLNWNRPFLITIVKQSLPYALLVLLMTFYNRIDSIVLQKILPDPKGNTEAGIYAMAYRLLDAFNMIAFLFSFILLPIFSRMIKQKQPIEDMVKLSFTLLITISGTVAISCHFYSHELMELLYNHHTHESAEVFQYLIFGFIAISSSYVFGTLLTANGSLKPLNIIAAGSMVINLAVNIILVPYLFAVGSAIASLSAQFASMAAQIIAVYLIFRFRINWRFLAAVFSFLGGLLLAAFFSKQLPYDWYINFALLIVFAFVFAALLRLLSIKGFMSILKEQE